AWAFGVTIAAVWSGIARHRAADREAPLDAMDLFLAPLYVPWRRARIGILMMLPIIAFALPSAVERMDLDFLMQKLSVLVVWILAFALVYGREPDNVEANLGRPARTLVAPALVLVAYWLAVLGGPVLIAKTGDARLNPEFVLDRYAALDPSLHLITDASR